MPMCAACSAENPDKSRFCNQCGTPLAANAAPVPAPRAYTPRHLAEKILQSRAAMVGERKRVTVLFADIKGSTKLAEEAGAESWHTILDRYFGILGAAVHRYEGTINQYTGDGVMALFGAPVAHEDHAQRACLAALEAQREVRRYADELRLSAGLNISMRVGLNTGEVIVGRIGDDLRMDYTAQGLTVNLAARMEQICEPGRITCTRATAALVEGYMRLRDLGDMRVAGASGPVRVYEVEGEGAIKTRLERGLARGAARFVGREHELERLRAALAQARGGRGGIVAVIGEAGIGKSRLCHEFAAECEAQGVAVHRATGVPYANALPLFPVQTLLRRRLGIAEHATPVEARRLAAGGLLLFDAKAAVLLPQVLEFLGIVDASARSADGASNRDALLEVLARFVPHAEVPQVLLVEDLHFADPGSEAFLAALAREVAGTSTLLLLNFRPDYAARWLPTDACTRIAVAALGPAEIEAVAQELLGPHDSLGGLAAQLRERAGGNPFYVEEAVQALTESGHLAGAPGAYRLARAIAEWPIPDTVHALIAARIDRLDPEHKSLLQAASVIGQGFTAQRLAQLAELETAVCTEQLARLSAIGLVKPPREPDEELRFAHPLTQEIAYLTQLEKSRAAAHTRLAQLLEQDHPLNAPPDDAAHRIAHHWARAGEWTRAGEWNLRAARWAGTQDATTGLAQYRLAMEHLERAPRSAAVDRMRIAARAGLVRMAQFIDIANEEVERVYAEAYALARNNRDTPALAELLISYGIEQLHRGDALSAVALATEAQAR